jgi:hypothetical protein
MSSPLASALCALALASACNNPNDTRAPATPASPEASTREPASSPTPATAAPTAAPAASSSGGTEEPTPDPITHPCVVAAAQYSIAIDESTADCRSDADCGCYQGGIGKGGCGGVLNKKSVKKLDAIAKQFHEMKCPVTTHCAPWICKPRCEGGACRK